jgi:hypothetical protein
VPEVRERQRHLSDLAGDVESFLVREREQPVEQPELLDDLERGRVDGVAAEIAKEVGVLLEHRDGYARAREEEAEHHAGGSAAGNDALDSSRRGLVGFHGKQK